MNRIILMFFAVAAILFGCGRKDSVSASDSSVTDSSDSTIVIYYSQTGTTKAVAEEISRQLGCAIAEIEAVVPYDGDYDATIMRWREERDGNVNVAIKPLDIDFSRYKTVFLGFPIWGGSFALPMATFLSEYSLAGKKVVTFATFGSGGLDAATSDIFATQPGAEVIRGYGVRNARIEAAPSELTRFLIEGGYVDGETIPLPPFSESAPVNRNDIDIFNAACGGYKYPLGSPVKVARRTTPSGEEYCFDVKSSTPDGSLSSSTIFVTVAEGALPEFTEVVRR